MVMKKTVKHISVFCIVLSLILLVGCFKYSSKYFGLGLVSLNTKSHAALSFLSFRGSRVYKLKYNGDKEGILNYSGKIKNGSATIYFDMGDGKNKLFEINDEVNVESSLTLTESCTIYIIIETDGECNNGSFDFKIE